jgi:hypothetical protein
MEKKSKSPVILKVKSDKIFTLVFWVMALCSLVAGYPGGKILHPSLGRPDILPDYTCRVKK